MKPHTKKNKTVYEYDYVDKNNKKIKNKKTLERISKLRIPPGYDNVLISASSSSDIQATGIDDKGRKQYIYNKNFTMKKQTEKYINIIKLGENIDKIIKKVEKVITANYKKSINNWDQPETNVALIVYLLYNCNLRIGNLKYVNNYNSYGALTLKGNHLKLVNNKLLIEFVGKKGVINKSTITNKKVIQLLMTLKKNYDNNFIFQENNRLMSVNPVNIFLKQYNEQITPKMFRTWYANYYFLEILGKDIKANKEELIKICSSKTKIKSYLKRCCEYIANKLNNTPTISKKSYLDNQIVEIFTNNACDFINFIIKNNKLSNNVLLIKIMKSIK